MTNEQAITQLRETASAAQAVAGIRALLAVLIAQGATPHELMNLCGNVLETYAEQEMETWH